MPMNRKETDAALRVAALATAKEAFAADAPIMVDDGAFVVPALDANGAERFVEVKVIVKAPDFKVEDAIADFDAKKEEREARATLLAEKKAETERKKAAKAKAKG